ncbi:hypothetical protein ID866_10968 [Astraeus odoratus]|nr:hypothetical protein ID866_10968 [Astraeus odoratus]
MDCISLLGFHHLPLGCQYWLSDRQFMERAHWHCSMHCLLF